MIGVKMRRREKLGAQTRCRCIDDRPAAEQRFDVAHMRVRDRIKDSVLMLKRAVERTVYWERSLGWILTRGLLVLVTFVAMLVINRNAPRTEAGLVEYKYVAALNEGKLQVLMLNIDGKVIAMSERPEYGMGLSGKDLVIDQTMENEIIKQYSDLEYMASIRLFKTNQSEIFILSRDIFNSLAIGRTLKFEIDMPRGDRIRKLITEDTGIIVRHTNDVQVQHLRQYMYQ